MPPPLEWIRTKFASHTYDITVHGYEEMVADDIAVEVLESAIEIDAPRIIEDYPDDERGASCLLIVWLTSIEPVHIVIAYWYDDPIIVTAYRPNPDQWEADFRRRSAHL